PCVKAKPTTARHGSQVGDALGGMLALAAMAPLFLLVAAQLLGANADTGLFPAREELLRLYTNCDEGRWPYGLTDTLVPKTPHEIAAGVARRRALEDGW